MLAAQESLPSLATASMHGHVFLEKVACSWGRHGGEGLGKPTKDTKLHLGEVYPSSSSMISFPLPSKGGGRLLM